MGFQQGMCWLQVGWLVEQRKIVWLVVPRFEVGAPTSWLYPGWLVCFMVGSTKVNWLLYGWMYPGLRLVTYQLVEPRLVGLFYGWFNQSRLVFVWLVVPRLEVGAPPLVGCTQVSSSEPARPQTYASVTPKARRRWSHNFPSFSSFTDLGPATF